MDFVYVSGSNLFSLVSSVLREEIDSMNVLLSLLEKKSLQIVIVSKFYLLYTPMNSFLEENDSDVEIVKQIKDKKKDNRNNKLIVGIDEKAGFKIVKKNSSLKEEFLFGGNSIELKWAIEFLKQFKGCIVENFKWDSLEGNMDLIINCADSDVSDFAAPVLMEHIVSRENTPNNSDWVCMSTSENILYRQGDVVRINNLYFIVIFNDSLRANHISLQMVLPENEVLLEKIDSRSIGASVAVYISSKDVIDLTQLKFDHPELYYVGHRSMELIDYVVADKFCQVCLLNESSFADLDITDSISSVNHKESVSSCKFDHLDSDDFIPDSRNRKISLPGQKLEISSKPTSKRNHDSPLIINDEPKNLSFAENLIIFPDESKFSVSSIQNVSKNPPFYSKEKVPVKKSTKHTQALSEDKSSVKDQKSVKELSSINKISQKKVSKKVKSSRSENMFLNDMSVDFLPNLRGNSLSRFRNSIYMDEYDADDNLYNDSRIAPSIDMNRRFENGIDLDNMTYEQILEMEEKVGKVNKGLSSKELEFLPLDYYDSHEAVSWSSEEKTCPICYTEFEPHDIIRPNLIFCTHKFHKECIDEWLSKNQTCPICRTIIKCN